MSQEKVTGAKRRALEAGIDSEKDVLEITPLGAGNEVGRSCIIIRFKGKTVMLDCGIHPAFTGIAALPYLDEIDPKEIDLILVSHFHLDHAAALPYFLEKTDFRGRCFMTHPTKSIYKLILQDYVKVSTISVEETLYDETDLNNSMDKIEVLNYHQVVHHKGIKFWCYNAGHVLGAAMFMVEIAGVRILYTGDYSRREDRHLMSAELPEGVSVVRPNSRFAVAPEVLIVESTYGVQTLQPVEQREQRFTELVRQIVTRGGRCLIPVFALGRAQELLLLLEEYWEQHRELQNIPVYYASALAKKCMTVYQTYINMMNDRIRTRSQFANPFVFKHIFNLKGMDYFNDTGPCVVMASPGMLQNGLSRDLFELWCTDGKNGCLIPGYCVEGTLAKTILAEPKSISAANGRKLPLNCSVHYISFSAHADFKETSDFVEVLHPPHVILVHGESNQMMRLKQALLKQYTDETTRINSPQNCQTVELEFRAQKIAKTVGRLAGIPPEEGSLVSGLLVRKDFTYHIMDAVDLPTYTPLATTKVQQKTTVPFAQSYTCLKEFLGRLYTIDVVAKKTEEVAEEAKEVKPDTTKPSRPKGPEEPVARELGPPLRVHGAVTVRVRRSQEADAVVKREAGVKAEEEEVDTHSYAVSTCGTIHGELWQDHVILEWESTPVTDMVADSVVALIMTMQASPGVARFLGNHHACSHDAEKKCPLKLVRTGLQEVFGKGAASFRVVATERGRMHTDSVTDCTVWVSESGEVTRAQEKEEDKEKDKEEEKEGEESKHEVAALCVALDQTDGVVVVDPPTVLCEDEEARQQLEEMLQRVVHTLLPMPSPKLSEEVK